MANPCYSIVLWGYFNVGQLTTTKYSPNKSECAPENEYLHGGVGRSSQIWSSINHRMGAQKSVKNLFVAENSIYLSSICTTLAHTKKYLISNSHIL